uniref:Protein kinase domain-containing protein n=1 Tax=Callorhinchus milii TaxID=7868 RepID=A0A4W3H5L5_CALMI
SAVSPQTFQSISEHFCQIIIILLRHANLVQYLGMCCTEQEDSIVVNLLVEHVGGSNLGAVLRARDPVPVDRLRHYATQLLSVLDYLHSNSVVHKVLSANRVLLDSHGNLRLTDYSIAKRLGTPVNDFPVTV